MNLRTYFQKYKTKKNIEGSCNVAPYALLIAVIWSFVNESATVENDNGCLKVTVAIEDRRSIE